MTFSGVAALGAAAAVAAAAAFVASPAAAVGVLPAPALHITFRQVSPIPPELLVGKQPPGFFPPGTEPTPVPQQAPSPTASAAPSMVPSPSPSMTPTPTASMSPTPVPTAVATASPTMTPAATSTTAPTTSPSMSPTAAPSAAPSVAPLMPGGPMTPTRERVSVSRSRGKVLARTRDAECILATYDGYRPRVTTRRPVVYTDATGKKMAVVSLKRRSSCVIPQGDPSKGAATGVVFGGKVYAALGASGEGGWCEAGVALAKDAVSTARKSSQSLRAGVKVYVYTEGEAMCDLVPGTRKVEEDD